MKFRLLFSISLALAFVFTSCCKMGSDAAVVSINYSLEQTKVTDTLMGVYARNVGDTLIKIDTLQIGILSGFNGWQTDFTYDMDMESLILYTKSTQFCDTISDLKYNVATSGCKGFNDVNYRFNGVVQENDKLFIKY